MTQVSKLELWPDVLKTKREFRKFVDAVKSLDKDLRSLVVLAFVPGYTWAPTNYCTRSGHLELLDGLQEVRFNGIINFIVDMDTFDGPKDPRTNKERRFADGFYNLGKVLCGEMKAKDFEWPGLKPRSSKPDSDDDL